jgi:dienelactone hydrolase
MRILLVCIAFTLTLSSGTANAQNGTNAPGKDVARADLLHIPVRDNGLVGTLVVPKSTRAYPGILRLGGGEGGIQVGDAETIASEGYAVFAIAYFGMEGLPSDLQEVPLEYFGKAIKWMKHSIYIDATKLAVIGVSRGSTLALLLPTIYRDFEAIVAIAPSHVVWQSHYLNWNHYAVRSSLSYHGKALPFVPYDFSNKAASAACNSETAACVGMYEQSLKQRQRVRAALIPVERIRAPVLLLSGKADSMWPSSKMGDLVIQRLAKSKHPYEHLHIAYDKAGHCSINRCYDSVPSAGDGIAIEDMRRQLIEFLYRHLRSKQQTRP